MMLLVLCPACHSEQRMSKCGVAATVGPRDGGADGEVLEWLRKQRGLGEVRELEVGRGQQAKAQRDTLINI